MATSIQIETAFHEEHRHVLAEDALLNALVTAPGDRQVLRDPGRHLLQQKNECKAADERVLDEMLNSFTNSL